MYYFLNCFGPLDRDRASLKNIPQFEDVFWNTGSIVTKLLPDPIAIDLYTDEGDAMVPMFNAGILVMSNHMINALLNSGVDNLQVFNAILRDKKNGKRYDDYSVVNIVGKVSCADLTKSTFSINDEPIIDVDFESVVIDESKTRNFLMFRMAECISGIIVHHSIKKSLESANIQYLDFISPEDWVG